MAVTPEHPIGFRRALHFWLAFILAITLCVAAVAGCGKDETMVFKFIPTTSDSTSPTDTTWKIIRWSEVAF